jgi:hypothetical protein
MGTIAGEGFPSMGLNIVKTPFDYLGDTLRGTKGILTDMYRHPKDLLAACEAYVPVLIKAIVGASDRSGAPAARYVLHKGADAFMSQAQFEKFYWPTWKQVVTPIMPVLMDTFHITLPQAGSLMSILALVGLILALPAGIILQKLGTKVSGLVALAFTGAGAVMGALSGSFEMLMVSRVLEGVGMGLIGFLTGAVPTATFAAAPEVMRKPQWAGLGLAVILLGQNFGQLVGPVIFGQFVNAWGWAAAGYAMIPVCLIGFASAWMVRVR